MISETMTLTITYPDIGYDKEQRQKKKPVQMQRQK